MVEHSASTSSFLDGWLSRFKKQWDLRKFKTRYNRRDRNDKEVTRELPTLREQLSSFFEVRYVLNAYEIGLKYGYGLELQNRGDCKARPGKEKEMISMPACANATGTEKLNRIIIDSALRLRPFEINWLQNCVFGNDANKNPNDKNIFFRMATQVW